MSIQFLAFQLTCIFCLYKSQYVSTSKLCMSIDVQFSLCEFLHVKSKNLAKLCHKFSFLPPTISYPYLYPPKAINNVLLPLVMPKGHRGCYNFLNSFCQSLVLPKVLLLLPNTICEHLPESLQQLRLWVYVNIHTNPNTPTTCRIIHCKHSPLIATHFKRSNIAWLLHNMDLSKHCSSSP